MNSRRWLGRLVLASAFGTVAAAFSCKTFILPDEICDAKGLKGPLLVSSPAHETCTRCLEDSCCDVVGACQNTAQCFETVKGVHECVLDAGLAGATAEPGCATAGGLDRDAGRYADDTYRCMRDQCGEPCGLPVCRVDPAALLIQSASCDGCFASSCCRQLNACYRNRACKLSLECITDSCGAGLGANLLGNEVPGGDFRLGGGGSDDDDEGAPGDGRGPEDVAGQLCGDAGARADRDGPNIPKCIRDCLCKFAGNDQGLTPLDIEEQAFVLGARVYECGVNARCGSKCPPPPADASADGAAP